MDPIGIRTAIGAILIAGRIRIERGIRLRTAAPTPRVMQPTQRAGAIRTVQAIQPAGVIYPETVTRAGRAIRPEGAIPTAQASRMVGVKAVGDANEPLLGRLQPMSRTTADQPPEDQGQAPRYRPLTCPLVGWGSPPGSAGLSGGGHVRGLVAVGCIGAPRPRP